jgi:hypothetical protein
MPTRPHHGRKLLVASIGVATLNYVGLQCGGSTTTSNETEAGSDAVSEFPVGNLAPAPHDAPSGADAVSGHADARDAIDDFPVANLVAFPPDAIDDFPVANLVAFPEAGAHDTGGHDAKE